LYAYVQTGFLRINADDAAVAIYLPVQRFVSPTKFSYFKVFGEKDLDFMQVVSSPLTRSSYHAEEIQKLMKKYPR